MCHHFIIGKLCALIGLISIEIVFSVTFVELRVSMGFVKKWPLWFERVKFDFKPYSDIKFHINSNSLHYISLFTKLMVILKLKFGILKKLRCNLYLTNFVQEDDYKMLLLNWKLTNLDMILRLLKNSAFHFQAFFLEINLNYLLSVRSCS